VTAELLCICTSLSNQKQSQHSGAIRVALMLQANTLIAFMRDGFVLDVEDVDDLQAPAEG
jgi:hypothetical protein